MRKPVLLLILLACFACHSAGAKSKVASQKKQEQKPKPKVEYVGDNTAPLEIRALRDAHQLQKDMNKKQEQEKEILKERD